MRRCIVVLLVALAACSQIQPIPKRGTSVPTAGTLPPIPESIDSPLGPVPIVFQDTLVNEQGRPLMGGFHSGLRTIFIHKGLRSLAVQWQVVLHEVCHVRLYDAGFRQNTADVDAFCDVMSTARVMEMLARKP